MFNGSISICSVCSPVVPNCGVQLKFNIVLPLIARLVIVFVSMVFPLSLSCTCMLDAVASPVLVMVTFMGYCVLVYGLLGTCICVGRRSGLPVVLVVLVRLLLVSFISYCWLSESVTAFRVCSPTVCGIQFQVRSVVPPIDRLLTFCVPRLVVPSNSSTLNAVDAASPMLATVTYIGYDMNV